MDDFVLKVTPEKLISTAEAITQKVNLIKNTLSGTLSKIQQIPSFWIGEAANLHIEKLKEQVPRMEELIQNFTSDAAKLQAIAGNDRRTVDENKGKIESLPNNVIL